MPKGVVEAVLGGKNIPLNTDPDSRSFVCYLARKKSQYEDRGHSILERRFERSCSEINYAKRIHLSLQDT